VVAQLILINHFPTAPEIVLWYAFFLIEYIIVTFALYEARTLLGLGVSVSDGHASVSDTDTIPTPIIILNYVTFCQHVGVRIMSRICVIASCSY
jgi:hypothetical protein